jgi:hypothetical protein
MGSTEVGTETEGSGCKEVDRTNTLGMVVTCSFLAVVASSKGRL